MIHADTPGEEAIVILAAGCAVVAAIATWLYGLVAYGFILGCFVAVPASAIAGLVTFGAVRFLWPLALIGATIGVIAIIAMVAA